MAFIWKGMIHNRFVKKKNVQSMAKSVDLIWFYRALRRFSGQTEPDIWIYWCRFLLFSQMKLSRGRVKLPRVILKIDYYVEILER